MALLKLGYRSIVLVDSDKLIDQKVIAAHEQAGGKHVQWEPGRATEHELFISLDDEGVAALINRAIEIHGKERIGSHISHYSKNTTNLDAVQFEKIDAGFQEVTRKLLGDAAHEGGWFKTQSHFEELTRDIVAPRLDKAHEAFRERVKRLFGWAHEH